MKDIRDVLKQKEFALEQLYEELSALYLVVRLLAEPCDPEIETLTGDGHANT